MRKRLVLNDFRVQELTAATGHVGFTIVDPNGTVFELADGFLRRCNRGTDRTYAYLLVDHLRWLAREGLSTASITLQDLERYMMAVGAEAVGPYGRPWREGRDRYGHDTLATAAACLKQFYSFQAGLGANTRLGVELNVSRLPSRADRRRRLLGHALTSVPANPLAPKQVRVRHPKMPVEGATGRLRSELSTARDRMVVTWLSDGGFRVGELCGLHLVDLHLREGAACGQCRSAHVHICHREGNPNRARAKTKYPWSMVNGVIVGGLWRRVSPAMIHTYYEYMTGEYPADAEHGMLLVQLHGPGRGRPLAPVGVRRMLQRAGVRMELGRVVPHAFRHEFATGVLDASGGNAMVAKEAGGWASAAMVEQVYGHPDIHDPVFAQALQRLWDQP